MFTQATPYITMRTTLSTRAIITATLMILLTACGTVNKGVQVINGDRGKFNGTWTLTNVSYEALIAGTVSRVFDQAAPAAFVGSVWILTNSGNAQYTLTDGSSQSIYWSYYNPGNGVQPMFQFKKVYQGDKPKNVAEGYRLEIGRINDSGMVLKSPVDLGGGRTGYVVYTFAKSKE